MQKCPLLDCSTLSVQTGSSYNIVASPAKYKQSRIPSRDTEINKSIQLHVHQCLKHLFLAGTECHAGAFLLLHRATRSTSFVICDVAEHPRCHISRMSSKGISCRPTSPALEEQIGDQEAQQAQACDNLQGNSRLVALLNHGLRLFACFLRLSLP